MQGYAFQSQIVSQVDEAGLVIDNIVPRAKAYQFCEKLPCSYTVPGLYGRAGFRLSVEVVIQYKSVMPLCDPWCSPTSFWWCIPCTGIYAQTVLTIGGCAPYQNWHHCGGALSIWVTDAGEVRWGFQTFVESFSLLPIFTGGGMRVVDISVPAKGFKLHNGQTAKILATYDGLCNCTKVYINDKLRGIVQIRLTSGNTFSSPSLTSQTISSTPSLSDTAYTLGISPQPRISFLTQAIYPLARRTWRNRHGYRRD